MFTAKQKRPGGRESWEGRAWQLTALLAGTAAAALVRAVAVAAWRTTRHDDPPAHPSAAGVRMVDALVWAVSLAVGAAVSKVLAERAAAVGWEQVTGAAPPDLNR